METIKNLVQNLSKMQKIGIFVFCQLVFIVVMVTIINFTFKDKEYIEIADEGILLSVPDSGKKLYRKKLWDIITQNVDGLDKSVIDDAMIRDGSYNVVLDDSKNNTKQIDFLVDIDSIKQTYWVTLAWFNGDDSMPIINCPPISEMKYKETFCQGMYNDTNSFSLYFPHILYGEKDGKIKECDMSGECEIKNENYDDGSSYDAGLLYNIDGDEDEKTITIESSVCNVEKYNQEALEYIKNYTPFYDNTEYTIEYKINNRDVVCGRT